jgi:hypothetical protein
MVSALSREADVIEEICVIGGCRARNIERVEQGIDRLDAYLVTREAVIVVAAGEHIGDGTAAEISHRRNDAVDGGSSGPNAGAGENDAAAGCAFILKGEVGCNTVD